MPCVPEFKYVTCDIKLYKICTECEKDACVPEKYYKNEVCTVSTKKMPDVPQKMP